MTAPFRRQIAVRSPDETARLAQRLAPALGPGDLLLLEGPIGAGKTHFARSLIHARLAAAGAPPEDVPSPTFTLVQTYEAGPVEIWHADLYRLTHPDEVEELGLAQAFDEAICLVEWPDRLGGSGPASALTLSFEAGAEPDTRHLTLASEGADWAARLDPVLADLAEIGDGP